MSQLRVFKCDGIPFYTNRNKGDNVMHQVIEGCKKQLDKMPIAQSTLYKRSDREDVKSYSKYANVSQLELEKLLEKNNNIFDMMTITETFDRLRIPFDIDFIGTEDPLENCKKVIIEQFPDAVMNI